MNKETSSDQNNATELVTQISNILGNENVLTGDAADYFSTDVYRQLHRPLAVAKPASVEKLQALMLWCHENKVVTTTRGGGASYTDGYLPNKPGCLILDLGALNKIEEVCEEQGYVTVESGVTWAELKETLDPLGLRTPFWGPFSGLRATVGGSVSQNAISHGSGAYGVSAESVISMDIVLADGSLLRTGSAAAQEHPFLRFFGPDLAGLFTGDCGALGVKARITLPLLRKRTAHQTISFAFETFESMHESMRLIALERLEDSHFALDGALSQGQIARQDNPRQILSIAWSILKTSPSYFQGVKQLMLSVVSGRKAISSSAYMTHYIVEGINEIEAKSRLHRIREINLELGQEIPATVPSIVRGMPFAPFFNTLGPSGERWVPLHGILPHSSAASFHKALEAFYEKYSEKMKELGVWHGGMFSAVGSSGFLYEIALYWPDEISCYHRNVIPKEYLEQLTKHPANPEARAFVDNIKRELIELY